MKFFRFVLPLMLVLLAATARAQTPTATTGQHFGVDIAAADAETAQAYTWRIYSDGATAGVVATSVTCTATATAGVQTCVLDIPAYTPGQHSVQFSAANVFGESPKSSPFVFTFGAAPNTPSNARIIGQ